MKNIYKSSILIIFFISFVGCAKTVPLISHAHVGHALTSWHDTPDQIGLYVSAQNEANEALLLAQILQDEEDVQVLQRGVQKIAYLLNPDGMLIKNADSGQHYGIIRALEGVLDHIEFAASSQDASLNLVSSVNDLSKNGEQVLNNFIHIFNKTQQFADSAKPQEQVKQLYKYLFHTINGQRQGDTVSVYGMVDFTDDFNAMLSREQNPRYEPLPRKYVLGLVRLPNGHWGYKLKSDRDSTQIIEY